MSIFGKISGRTAEALLSEEKNAEYRALGAERLGDLAFSHANSLSAKADQGVLAAENETAACTIIKELQAIGQTCKQGLPTEETLVRMVELCLRYKVPIPSVPKWREELQGVQNPNKTSTRFLAEAATGTDVQLWAAKYPIGWRLNIGEYLRSMNLITETVKSAAELQQQLDSKRQNNQKAADAQDELDQPSSSDSEEESEQKKKRKKLARSGSKGKGWMAGEITRHCIPEAFSTGKRLAHTRDAQQMGPVAPLDEKSRKKLLKVPGPWKGAPEVNHTFPVLHQLESARMVAVDTAKQREATAKQGVKKYANPRHHQANRLKMNDRLSRASSTIRHIREAVLEPADVTMAKVDTRFAEAERKASEDSEADHATGAATREAAAQQGLATLTQTAVALGAANTAAQHAQANAAAAKAAVDAKTAHDHAEQTYRDARDEATAWLAEKEAKATKARADALQRAADSNDHQQDLATLGKITVDQLHLRAGLRAALEEHYDHDQLDKIEKEIVAATVYEGQQMARSGALRAEDAMKGLWISADTPHLRTCMIEGRAATTYEWAAMLSDAQEQHRRWEHTQLLCGKRQQGHTKPKWKKRSDFGTAAQKSPALWTVEQALRHLQVASLTAAVLVTRLRSKAKEKEKEKAKERARAKERAARLEKAKASSQTSLRGALGKARAGSCPPGHRWVTRGVVLTNGRRLTKTIAVPEDTGTYWCAVLDPSGQGVNVLQSTPEFQQRKRQRLEVQRRIQRACKRSAQSSLHLFMSREEPQVGGAADHSEGNGRAATPQRAGPSEANIGGDDHGVARALAGGAVGWSADEVLGILAAATPRIEVDRGVESRGGYNLSRAGPGAAGAGPQAQDGPHVRGGAHPDDDEDIGDGGEGRPRGGVPERGHEALAHEGEVLGARSAKRLVHSREEGHEQAPAANGSEAVGWKPPHESSEVQARRTEHRQEGRPGGRRDDRTRFERCILPSSGGEDLTAATANVGLVAKKPEVAPRGPTCPRSPSMVPTEAPVYNTEPRANERAAPVHQATAAGTAGAGRMWDSHTTQDRRRASELERATDDEVNGSGTREISTLPHALTHYSHHDGAVRLPLQREEMRSGTRVTTDLARLQMVLPLHDVRSTGGQDREGTARDAGDAHPLPAPDEGAIHPQASIEGDRHSNVSCGGGERNSIDAGGPAGAPAGDNVAQRLEVDEASESETDSDATTVGGSTGVPNVAAAAEELELEELQETRPLVGDCTHRREWLRHRRAHYGDAHPTIETSGGEGRPTTHDHRSSHAHHQDRDPSLDGVHDIDDPSMGSPRWRDFTNYGRDHHAQVHKPLWGAEALVHERGDAAPESVSSTESRDLLRVDPRRAERRARLPEQEGTTRRVQPATSDILSPAAAVVQRRQAVHGGLVRRQVEQAEPQVLHVRQVGSAGTGGGCIHAELGEGATRIVDIRGDLVCISTDVEQGMRTDGKSDHIAASQLNRDSCAAMEARLAHQLTSLSDGLAKVTAMQLKATQAAVRLQHRGLGTTAILDLSDPSVSDYYAFVSKYRKQRANFIPGSRLTDGAAGYKKPARGEAGRHHVGRWRRFTTACVEVYGRVPVDLDDTAICAVLERIVKSGSDAKQLLSTVHTVIEKALCANFDRDSKCNKDLVAVGNEIKPSTPRYTKSYDPALLFLLIQKGKSLHQMALSEVQWRFQMLLRMHLVWRGDDLYKFDWRDWFRVDDAQDKIRHLELYDEDGDLVGPDDLPLVQTARLRCKGGKTDGGGWSKAVTIHRINVGLLVDESVEHRSTRGRAKQLDVFRYWNELWERGHEVMKTVTRGHTFTNLTGAHLEKTAGLALRQPTLAAGLNQAVKKKLAIAGIHCALDKGDEGATDDVHLTTHTLYAGHAVRGNCGSVIEAVHRLGRVQYDAEEHLHRARHSTETFERNYRRPVPMRILRAAERHPHAEELTADDVLFL